jgi:hypothetical protein
MKKALLIILLLTSTFAISRAEGRSIVVLNALKGDIYQDIIELLGPPVDKSGYTISKAPTKSWHHGYLFSLYPQNEKNKHVQIMEVIWEDGDYCIFACFHIIEGKNRCIVAKRIHRSVKF